ncbi:uncharacterized protein LOC124956083 [Vespa velutina]|uniref:uncharacterized protein LOC124956083 n=1 Tax=Vespa velutina TaxID=202808 RepID=UPI001FB23081|nr:uncharacterized protein LOC124956083 [Vespa velutina]
MAAESARLRRRNLKGEISGLIKNSHKIRMEGIKTLSERFETRADNPPSAKETIAQLKAELRAKDLRNREVMEENVRLKRGNKRMEKVLENPPAGNSRSKSPDVRESIRVLTQAVRGIQQQIQQLQQQQQQRQQTSGGATTGAGGPHKGPTLRAEPTRLPAQQVNVGKELIGQEDFVQVLGRKERRPQKKEANALPLTTPKDGVSDRHPLPGQTAFRKEGKKKRGAQRRRKREKREREVAAISLSCAGEMTYRDVVLRATEKVNLKDLGIVGMTCKRGLTGAFIWQVRGKGATEKADQVVEALRSSVPGVKVTRPLRTSTIRLVGLDPAANGTWIRNALLELHPGTNPNLIKVGEIRIGRGRLAETTVTAPTPVIQAALKKDRIILGLTVARVQELKQRPLRCHRCLARGHVAAMYSATKPRVDLCYVCGKPDHLAKRCTNKAACPICSDTGRKPTNHRAGSWECPVVPPRKWVDKAYGSRTNVRGETIQKDPHKVVERTAMKAVSATEKNKNKMVTKIWRWNAVNRTPQYV